MHWQSGHIGVWRLAAPGHIRFFLPPGERLETIALRELPSRREDRIWPQEQPRALDP